MKKLEKIEHLNIEAQEEEVYVNCVKVGYSNRLKKAKNVRRRKRTNRIKSKNEEIKSIIKLM